MQLTVKQQAVMDASGHLIVTGGPGSGKTTVSIRKAGLLAERELRAGQSILFLSFARATVSRIVEAIESEHQIPIEQKRRIDVETYHSFFWRILKAHGYLIGLPRLLSILTPPAEGIALSTIRSDYGRSSTLNEIEKAEKRTREGVERSRLAHEDGQVCFDLFAPYVGNILDASSRIRKLLATRYPVVILDEFQDTNAEQWRVVKALGRNSKLIALADPEQRIYDFIGADPERLNHFKVAFSPTDVDLSDDNHRSTGTDIAIFGNDLLTGRFRQASYSGVELIEYAPYDDPAMTALVTATYAARKRLVESHCARWSVAVLVPTKKMTRLVSDAFRSPPGGMTAIPHVASIDMEAAVLAAELIALLLQPDVDGAHFGQLVNLLRAYFQGKGGDTPAKGDLAEAERFRKAHQEWLERRVAGKPLKKNSVLVGLLAVYEQSKSLSLTGDPDRDWRAMRTLLEQGPCSRMSGVANEARNIRLLERGMQLRQDLSADWRENGCYLNALLITRQAFVQEHFSTSAKPETGVVVMNMHKAKGKQFDEVIIFEGWPRRVQGKIVANLDRIVRGNERKESNAQARQNLRVSVTRGKRRTTILTPKGDPCVLFVNED